MFIAPRAGVRRQLALGRRRLIGQRAQPWVRYQLAGNLPFPRGKIVVHEPVRALIAPAQVEVLPNG